MGARGDSHRSTLPQKKKGRLLDIEKARQPNGYRTKCPHSFKGCRRVSKNQFAKSYNQCEPSSISRKQWSMHDGLRQPPSAPLPKKRMSKNVTGRGGQSIPIYSPVFGRFAVALLRVILRIEAKTHDRRRNG